MIRGLYTAASGLALGERLQDMLSNNLANAGTNGYKEQEGVTYSFPQAYMFQLDDHGGSGPGAGRNFIGKLGQGAFLQEIVPRFTQGALKPSENPYAYAIEDTVPDDLLNPAGAPIQGVQSIERAFFPVASPDNGGQTAYTRDGDFAVSEDGFLRTPAGAYLQAVDVAGQPIAGSRVGIDAATHQPVAFQLNPATNQYARSAGSFGIVTVSNAEKMVDGGNGMWTLGGAQLLAIGQPLPGNPTVAAAPAGVLRNKFVEASNVDPAQTMVSMISVMRAYEANTRVIRTLDQTMQKACDEVGRV